MQPRTLTLALCVTSAVTAAWLSIPAPPPVDLVEERAVTTADAASAASSAARRPSLPLEQPIAAVPATPAAARDSAPLDGDSERSHDQDDPSADPRAAVNAALSEAYALTTEFAAEARDRTWAETAEAELSNRIAQAAGLELTTLRSECRETVCRLDFTFPSRAYLETTGGELAMAAVSGTPRDETGDLILVGDNGTLTYYIRLREPKRVANE